jgi:hypothetical protein
MATFKEMQDRINLDYLNRTDLNAETKRAIIRAIKHYEKERFWFNLTATAVAIGTASTTVAIPTDFLAMDFATVAVDGNQQVLTIRSFDRIAYQNKTGASGVPTEICYWRDGLAFAPKPSSVTSITLHYTFSLPTLSADSDTNGWTSACEDLIVFRATYDMMANVLRVGDASTLESYKSMEMEAFKMIQFGNDMRQGSGMEGAVTGSNQGQSPKIPHKPT